MICPTPRSPAARPSGRPPWRPWLALSLACLLAACGGSDDFEEPVEFQEPETSIAYVPAVEGAPSEEIQDLFEASLAIYRREEEGAQSVPFLRRRLQGDVATAQKILKSYGYFRPTIETRVVVEPATEEAEEVITARMTVDPGPAFTLIRHDFRLNGFGAGSGPAIGPAEAYGSPLGMAAEASPILGAEGLALTAIRQQGFFYAERAGRESVADLETNEIEIDSRIETGQRYTYGPVSFTGAPNVDEDYLLTYLTWTEGEPVDPAQLSEYQRELLATGLFRSGIVSLPEEAPAEAGAAPVEVILEEAPFQTVSAGVRFGTDEGPAVRLGYEHRNLFGSNEKLKLTLDASLDEQVLTTEYRRPQFLRPKQEFVTVLELRRVNEDAFDELGGTLTAGIVRTLTDRWQVGAGGLLEVSLIEDEGEEETAYLAGLPVFAAYDSTGDLLNPTDGERARLDLIPFAGIFDDEATLFTSIDARASIYRPIDSRSRWVVAARGRLGAIPSDSLDDIPATRRLYSGGSGSVRGFAEDFVGPLDEDGDPIGGRSVVEGGLELRFPIFGDLGGVGFVEGGSVSDEIFPDFDAGFQYAAGGGFRYYSPVGPIRLDVAVPLNPRDADDSFQFYISIGQAF